MPFQTQNSLDAAGEACHRDCECLSGVVKIRGKSCLLALRILTGLPLREGWGGSDKKCLKKPQVSSADMVDLAVQSTIWPIHFPKNDTYVGRHMSSKDLQGDPLRLSLREDRGRDSISAWHLVGGGTCHEGRLKSCRLYSCL